MVRSIGPLGYPLQVMLIVACWAVAACSTGTDRNKNDGDSDQNDGEYALIWPATDSLIDAWARDLWRTIAAGDTLAAEAKAYRLGHTLLLTERDTLSAFGARLQEQGSTTGLQRQGAAWQALGSLLRLDLDTAKAILENAALEGPAEMDSRSERVRNLAWMRIAAAERDTVRAEGLLAELVLHKALAGKDAAVLDLLLSRARTHLEAGAPTRSRERYFEALPAAEELADPVLLGHTYMGLGWSYTDAGDEKRAVTWYDKALTTYRTAGHDRGLITALDALAYSYWGVLPADQVLPYWTEALDLARREGMTRKAAMIELNLARFMASLDSLGHAQIGLDVSSWQDSAIALIHRSEAGFVTCGDERSFLAAKRYEAGILNHAGEFDRSIRITEQLLDSARHRSDQQEIARCLVDLASNANSQGDHRSAIHHLEEAIPILERTQAQRILIQALQRYQFALVRSQRFREALTAADRIKVLSDSVHGIEVTDRLAQLDLRYRFAQEKLADSLQHVQDMELERQQREQAVGEQRARTRLASAVGGLLLAGGGLFFYLDRKRRRERFARQAAELETRALRAQMDPHFIGNTLHAVNGYLLGHDPQAASTLLSRFAKWIRSALESSRHELVPLGEDIEAMRTYLALEQARTGDGFTYQIDFPEDDELLRVRIPPMLVQPILENAIVHGVLPLEGKGHVELMVEDGDDHLLISVSDNGVGRKAAATAKEPGRKKSSLSARITEERLALLSARTGAPAGMRVVDLPQGTRVELRLPFAG